MSTSEPGHPVPADPYTPTGPYGGAGPAGAAALVPSQRPRRRGLLWAVVAVVVVGLLAAGAAAFVGVRRLVMGSPDRLVQHAPADAVAYGHVSLRPSASNLLGLASLAARVEEAAGEPLLDADRLAEEVDEEGAPDFAEDIRPWLGTQAAFFVSAPAGGADAPADPAGAVLVLVEDREAAAGFVEEHLGTVGGWDAGGDAQGWRTTAEDAGDEVVALTDDLLVVGTAAAVAQALDPAEETLADRDAYTELVEALPASVATAWVDVEETARAVEGLGLAVGAASAQDVASAQDLAVSQVALGLSLSSGAADVTAVSRPTADAEAPPEEVAAADLADLPAGGLGYLRLPDAGASLERALATADGADGGPGSAAAQADETLGAYGTDVATVAGWLGDVVATVAYDPAAEQDNAGLLVRAAVSDEAAAADLVDALVADVPPASGVEVAPGSVTAGSASLAVADGALELRAGSLPEGGLGEDPAWTAALDGLGGEPVAYLDVRALVGAIAPVLSSTADLTEEDRQGLDVLAAFDRLVVTTARGEDGLDRSRVRLSWGSELVPLDLGAPANPPDVDLGAFGDLADLAAPAAGVPADPFADPSTDPSTDPGAGLGTDPGAGLPAPDAGADDYGDDPALDALWDACAGGDGAACDDLYYSSPFGSGYEQFALTCGGRTEEVVGSCTEVG